MDSYGSFEDVRHFSMGRDYNLPRSEKFKLRPGRLTWNIIMEVWKIIFLSKWVICRFHVNLPECM